MINYLDIYWQKKYLIFYKQVLSWSFKIGDWLVLLEQGTGMEIPWLKINNSNSIFLNENPLNSATTLSLDKRAAGWVGFENRKIDES